MLALGRSIRAALTAACRSAPARGVRESHTSPLVSWCGFLVTILIIKVKTVHLLQYFLYIFHTKKKCFLVVLKGHNDKKDKIFQVEHRKSCFFFLIIFDYTAMLRQKHDTIHAKSFNETS